MAGENELIQQTTSSRSEQSQQPQSTGQDPQPPKGLLDLEKDECAKAIRRFWTDQETIMRRRRAQWRVNRLRRMGITGVQLVKQQDTHQWVVWAPPGGTFSIPTLNKADRLCRRLTSTLFADRPIPDATPSRDDDEAADSAEFATRVLIALGGEGGFDNNLTARQAFDTGCTYDSGFRRWYVDPAGGGTAPKTIIASPKATDAKFAVTQPNGLAWPPPYVTRFVTKQGQVTDDETQADTTWLPRLRCEVLSGKHVRFLPATARDIAQADGLLVGALVPLGQLKNQFPDIFQKLGPEDLRKMISERPEQYEDLLPVGIRPSDKVVAGTDPKDDSLCFVLSCYYRQLPVLYPKGFYGIVVGNATLLHRDVWYDARHKKPLDLPCDQFKIWDDEDDPYGKGAMRLLGPGNEVRAAQVGALLEHLDRFNNRKVFYPLTSALVPKAMQAATGTYIPINSGGQPTFEDIPTFPDSSLKMLDWVTGEMDDESGLQQTAQGLNPPSVQSGLHAQRIIEQVLLGLSDLKENAARAIKRGWRIQLQLLRAFFSTPQELKYVGDDGLYKVQRWTGADLGDTVDVDLQEGSFTMLTPSAKVAVAEHLAAMVLPGPNGQPQPLLSAMDLRHQAMTSVGGTVGLEDDPQQQRARRQIQLWMQGPPAQWDPQQGDPGIFTAVPADDEPQVAQYRHWELRRAMASTRFSRQPPEWQQVLSAEYQKARQAAGIATIAEQQQSQQQQAQQQMALEAKKAGPSLTVSVKGTDLDQNQTAAVLTDVGLQVPPPSPPLPPDPAQLAQVQAQQQQAQQQAETQRAETEGKSHDRLIKLAQAMKPADVVVNAHVHVPKGGGAARIVRDELGRPAGIEPIEPPPGEGVVPPVGGP